MPLLVPVPVVLIMCARTMYCVIQLCMYYMHYVVLRNVYDAM